jgi:alcohol dehydrogenase class IV
MQSITRGRNAISKAASILKEAGHEKIFLVTGEHLRNQSFIPASQCVHYIKQGVNVESQETEEAYKLFVASEANAIMAVGGGSVIDLAKAILYHDKSSKTKKPFFLAAPTTIGSGSEATHFAVVYDGKKKSSWVDDCMLPQSVILDSELVNSLPAYQAAITGMDTVEQAIESFWSQGATEESKIYARIAIDSWLKNFNASVKGDEKARAAMLEAAHAAGRAINITRTTGPHALSYYLTLEHGIPHGHAVALLLPLFFLYNPDSPELLALLGVKDNHEAIELLVGRMKEAGLATNLDELKISKEEVADELIMQVNKERFENNPRPLDADKLKELILIYL